MRRLAAVFSSKRDKSDPQRQPVHSHPSINKKPPKLPLTIGFTASPSVHTPSSITSTPQLSSVSDHGPSSGSSSGSASLSLPAPEEDPQAASLARNSTRRSWKNWLGGKRSERSEQKSTAVPQRPKPSVRDQPMPVWNERPHTLQDPRMVDAVSKEVDETEEESSSESDDQESLSVSDHPRTLQHTFVASPARARQNLELLIKNSLTPPLPASPFVQHSVTCLVPRSCNRPQALSPILDMRRTMFKRQLLRQLDKLSANGEDTILPFASRSAPVPINPPLLPDHETTRPPDTTRIFLASPGLRRWISRPCFEDRFSVFLPFKDGVQQTPVVSTLAVAALEYSEFLDVMVDPDFDPSLPPQDVPSDVWTPTLDDFQLHTPPPPVASNDTPAQTPPANSRSSYIPSPSPLRNQHNPEASLSKSTLHSTGSAPAPTLVKSASQSSQILPQSGLLSRSALSPAAAPVKRAVRFVEDDTEDTVPLYLVRQKKKREEKAKFLRTEQRKRLMEQEQERRRLEAEAMEQERKRLAKEKEDREMEQQQYTEAVAAARLRRETQRAGIIPGLKTDSNNLLLPSPSTSSLRGSERNRPHEPRRNSLMPHHTGSSSSIPRREASDSALSRSYPHSFETSSYRTGSGGYSPAGSNSGHGHSSRPGSMYSSSSEDGRMSSKRPLASNSTTRPFTDRTTSHPAQTGSNSSLHKAPLIPNVPPLPELMNDYILLPPSAPFMMHQHPRQSRNSSPGRSTSSGSLRGTSVNSSNERINMHRQPSYSRDAYSAPSSPGTSPSIPTHVKHGSGDSRRASMPAPTLAYASASTSQTTSFRGRPQIQHSQTTHGTQYLQAPNPWTGLPMQYGSLPMAVSPYSHSLSSNTLSKASSSGGGTKAKSGTKRRTIV